MEFWNITYGGLVVTDETTKVLLFKTHFVANLSSIAHSFTMSSNNSKEDLQMLKRLSASADVYLASTMAHCNTDRTMMINALHF
jgi:hypothetical protein